MPRTNSFVRACFKPTLSYGESLSQFFIGTSTSLLALRRKTTLNAIVRKGIEEFVSGDLSREAAVRGLEGFFRKTKARVGTKTWTRDELHEV